MKNGICAMDCGKCEMNQTCGGCRTTCGRPFGGECMIAACCLKNGYGCCGDCPEVPCKLKKQLMAEFNALGIENMEQVTELYALKGSFVNLEYTLPGGQTVRFWDDNRIYLGNQLPKGSSGRCYGLAADENYLLVCEYGADAADAKIVLYKRR